MSEVLEDMFQYIEVDSDDMKFAKKLNLGKRIEILDLEPRALDCLQQSDYKYIWQIYVFCSKDSLKDINNMGKKSAKDIVTKVKNVCRFDIVPDYDSRENLDEVESRLNLCRRLKLLH